MTFKELMALSFSLGHFSQMGQWPSPALLVSQSQARTGEMGDVQQNILQTSQYKIIHINRRKFQ